MHSYSSSSNDKASYDAVLSTFISKTDRLFLLGWKSFGVGALRLDTLCNGSQSVGLRNGKRS